VKNKKNMTNRMLSVPGGWVAAAPAKIDLDISEGTIYGARYYTVRPNFPEYAPAWFKPEWDIMVAWCVETFGPTPEDGVWTPGSSWYVNNSKFWFRNKADLEWFLLKWQ
jgi:hypothetical protein